MKGLCKFLLKVFGWKGVGGIAPDKKCIIIGAPHTSSWDFIMSWIFYTSMGSTSNALIKKDFFFWPMNHILRKIGGLPVDRSKGANVIRQTIQTINESETIHLAMTPEGTRTLTKKWKAGFHIIAKETGIPVYLGYFDWGKKEISIGEKFELSDDAKSDINRMKDFYREKGIKAKFPNQFTTEHQ